MQIGSNAYLRKMSRLWVVSILFFLFGFLWYPSCEVRAADRDSLTPEGIGTNFSYKQGYRKSQTGVSVSLDDQYLDYCYDYWVGRTDSILWDHDHQNFNGTIKTTDSMKLEPTKNFVSIYPTNSTRFLVNAYQYAKILPQQYAVRVTRYQNGKLLSDQIERTTDESNWITEDYGFLQARDRNIGISLGSWGRDSESCIYDIHTEYTLDGTNGLVFDCNGGRLEGLGFLEYDFAQKKHVAKSLPTAVRSGNNGEYLFDGWYTRPEGGTKVESGNTAVVGSTLYAHWKFISYSHNVICIDQIRTGPNAQKTLGTTQRTAMRGTLINGSDFGDQIQISRYYTGYFYSGCSYAVVGDEDCVVYRYFTPIQYEIRFMAPEATAGAMEDLTHCYYDEEIVLPRNVYRRGYQVNLDLGAPEAVCETGVIQVYKSFAGWSLGEEARVGISDGGTVKNLTSVPEVVSLNAVWDEEPVQVNQVARRLGYDFAGWANEPGATEGRTQFQVSEDMTLYAVWKARPVVYHVEYYKQRLDQNFEKSAEYTYDGYTDSNVELSDIESIYPGFYLDRESSTLSGVVQADGSLILTAYYRRGQYRVEFDLQGGSLPQGQYPDSLEGVFEQCITLPDVKPVKQGYDFVGWGVEPDAAQVIYTTDSQYLIPNHDQTLYAVYQARTDTPYSMTLFAVSADTTGMELVGTLSETGRTDATIGDALCEHYHTEDLDKAVSKAAGGKYHLVNSDILKETRIRADGRTHVSVYVERQRQEIYFHLSENEVVTGSAVYGQTLVLRDHIGNCRNISRYRDDAGNSMMTGQAVVVRGTLHLYPQYYIAYHIRSGVIYKYYDSGRFASLDQPETDMDSFEGWYEDEALSQFGGAPGEMVGPLTTNREYYARYSGSQATPAPDITSSTTPVPSASAPGKTPVAPATKVPAPGKTPLPPVTTAPAPGKTPQAGTTETPGTDQPSGKDPRATVDPGDDPVAHYGTVVDGTKYQPVTSGGIIVGSRVRRGKLTYQITAMSSVKRTVKVVRCSKNARKVTIPATISIRGKRYRVTMLGKKSFANCKRLRRVVIGKNVRYAKAGVFRGDIRLKKVIIQSKKMKKWGKNSWTGVPGSCRIRYI